MHMTQILDKNGWENSVWVCPEMAHFTKTLPFWRDNEVLFSGAPLFGQRHSNDQKSDGAMGQYPLDNRWMNIPTVGPDGMEPMETL
jgi:hypothetical protein